MEERVEKLPKSRSGVASPETVEIIEKSRTARLAGNRDQYRTRTRRARASLREDEESYVGGIAEEVEDNFNANFLRPAYRALKMLRSKSAPQVSSIRAADGHLVSNAEEYRARWAEYFEQLYRADPPSGQLPLAGEQMVAADPPIDVTAPSLAEVRKVVEGLKDGRAAGVCSISGEMLKAGGEPMILELHAVITVVWQTGKLSLSGKEKRTGMTTTTIVV